MKGVCIFLAIVFLIALSYQAAAAMFSYNVQPVCEAEKFPAGDESTFMPVYLGSKCITGEEVSFRIQYQMNYDEIDEAFSDYLKSYGDYEIRNFQFILKGIEIKDKQYDTVLARNDEEHIMDIDNPNIQLTLASILPAPHSGNTFYYVPCAERKISFEVFGCTSYNLLGKCLEENWTEYEEPFTHSCGRDALTLEIYNPSFTDKAKDFTTNNFAIVILILALIAVILLFYLYNKGKE